MATYLAALRTELRPDLSVCGEHCYLWETHTHVVTSRKLTIFREPLNPSLSAAQEVPPPNRIHRVVNMTAARLGVKKKEKSFVVLVKD